MRRRSLLTLVAASATTSAATLAAPPVRAQTWKPTAPVRFVVPFPPGSSVDLVGRLVADGAQGALAQTVVVENRPGGGTLVATQMVRSLPADGQVVLLAANSFTINPSLHRPAPYDALADFRPLALLAEMPHVLVAHPSVADDVAGFLARARQPGAGLSFGSNGQGTSQHLGCEQLKLMAGLNAEHVPYRGVPQMLLDLVAGRVEFAYGNLSDVLPAVRDGQLRALALAAPERHRLLPEVPTTAEAGLPGALSDTWYGMVMPAGGDPAVAAAMSRAILDSLNRPDSRKRLEEMGLDVVGDGPDAFAERMRRASAAYAAVVRATDLRPG